jgi:uncharacterized protein (DUF697 family)
VLANITHFWRLTRELDVGAIRDRFEQPVTLRILGSDLASARRIARLIEPDPTWSEVSAGVLGDDVRERGDAYVAAIAGALDATGRRALSELSVSGAPLVVVQIQGESDMLVLGVPDQHAVAFEPALSDDVARRRLFAALAQAAPDIMLPLGRRHPLLREATAEHLIRDTARVNAQFAAVSSLPANVPLIGGLVGDMADIIVLTKNQLILLFKLAGLYGRDLELGRQLIAEVLPVVGGAFVWRSTARMLLGLVPPLFGLVPKTIVAYSGTFVVGELARYYYRHGRKPPDALVYQLRAEGVRLARETLARLRPPR